MHYILETDDYKGRINTVLCQGMTTPKNLHNFMLLETN